MNIASNSIEYRSVLLIKKLLYNTRTLYYGISVEIFVQRLLQSSLFMKVICHLSKL